MKTIYESDENIEVTRNTAKTVTVHFVGETFINYYGEVTPRTRRFQSTRNCPYKEISGDRILILDIENKDNR